MRQKCAKQQVPCSSPLWACSSVKYLATSGRLSRWQSAPARLHQGCASTAHLVAEPLWWPRPGTPTTLQPVWAACASTSMHLTVCWPRPPRMLRVCCRLPPAARAQPHCIQLWLAFIWVIWMLSEVLHSSSSSNSSSRLHFGDGQKPTGYGCWMTCARQSNAMTMITHCCRNAWVRWRLHR